MRRRLVLRLPKHGLPGFPGPSLCCPGFLSGWSCTSYVFHVSPPTGRHPRRNDSPWLFGQASPAPQGSSLKFSVGPLPGYPPENSPQLLN